MSHVLVIERRPAARARALAAGVSAPFASELCEEPDQLDKRLLRRRFAAVVLPLAPGADPAVVGIIHAVRDRYPRIPVVVWCDEDAPGTSILLATEVSAEIDISFKSPRLKISGFPSRLGPSSGGPSAVATPPPPLSPLPPSTAGLVRLLFAISFLSCTALRRVLIGVLFVN